MTLHSLGEEQRRILTVAGTLADAHAVAHAAVGLRGQDAQRAMRVARRRRDRVRFEAICARVPAPEPASSTLWGSNAGV